MTMMRWFYKLPLRLRSLFRNDRVEQELNDELRFHLEKLIEEKLAKGMRPEQARYAALRELGALEQIKEECRDMRRMNFILGILEDGRYGPSDFGEKPRIYCHRRFDDGAGDRSHDGCLQCG